MSLLLLFSTGTPTVFGTATGDFVFTGPATGVRTVPGVAATAVAFDGPAEGTRGSFGTATGDFTFDGPAIGQTGTSGTAASDFTFDGPADGRRAVGGVAATAVTFDGPAIGARAIAGQAATTLAFDGPAVGSRTVPGVAATTLVFAGPAYGYVPAQVQVIDAGTVDLNWRWTLTCTPAGSVVRIYNPVDIAAGEPGLTLRDVAGIAEIVADATARTVTGDGDNIYHLIEAGSGWPPLFAGANTITIEGITAGQFDYTPLYT